MILINNEWYNPLDLSDVSNIIRNNFSYELANKLDELIKINENSELDDLYLEISGLEDDISDKDNEIYELNEEIQSFNRDIDRLNETIESLKEELRGVI